MLSISTAFFNVHKLDSWKKLLSQAIKLGFSTLELNVEVPEKFLPEIEKSVEKGEVLISSLHNYCPRIENLPAGRTIYSGYLLTADNEDERRTAIDYTLKTIGWASRLGARAVVVHAGEVPTDPSGRDFYKYISQFGCSGQLYNQYKNALLTGRKKKSPVYVERLLKSLDKILRFASEKNVIIGLENRLFVHEIPNTEEVCVILEKNSGAPIAYWHDVGHAEVFVRQGWVEKHEEFLVPFVGKTIGMHIHDLKGLIDHHAPGAGDFDFSILKPFIGNIELKVIEAHPKAKVKEVQASREVLRKSGLISDKDMFLRKN